MNEDIKKLQASVDIIAQTTADILSILPTLATKEDLNRTNQKIISVEKNLQTTINDIQTDIRSFKQDTQNNFDRLEKRMDDSDQTLMSYDKRIERLETKVFA